MRNRVPLLRDELTEGNLLVNIMYSICLGSLILPMSLYLYVPFFRVYALRMTVTYDLGAVEKVKKIYHKGHKGISQSAQGTE